MLRSLAGAGWALKKSMVVSLSLFLVSSLRLGLRGPFLVRSLRLRLRGPFLVPSLRLGLRGLTSHQVFLWPFVFKSGPEEGFPTLSNHEL